MRKLIRAVTIGIATAAAVAVVCGAAFERIARIRAGREFKAPGRLVIADGRRIQIDCRGTGSPTVVLQSGLDNYGSLSWVAVHDSIAATTRVCAYSRAGIMWSEPSKGPFSSDSAAHMLHSALRAAGESGPWVIAAHSLGGPYAVTFTSLYPAEVSGLVMVDVTYPEQFDRFTKLVGRPLMPTPEQPRLGARLAWMGLVRLAIDAATPPKWPRVIAQQAPAFFPTSLGALAAETEAIPATLERERSAESLGDRPLVVLHATVGMDSTTCATLGLTPGQGRELVLARESLAKDMARWSTRGRFEAVERASHYVQIDRPDAVIAAVRSVVTDVRGAR